MLMSNSSSSSITNSTVSRESAPMSLTKCVSSLIWSLLTPSCSDTLSMTRSLTEATSRPSCEALKRREADNNPLGKHRHGAKTMPKPNAIPPDEFYAQTRTEFLPELLAGPATRPHTLNGLGNHCQDEVYPGSAIDRSCSSR